MAEHRCGELACQTHNHHNQPHRNRRPTHDDTDQDHDATRRGARVRSNDIPDAVQPRPTQQSHLIPGHHGCYEPTVEISAIDLSR